MGPQRVRTHYGPVNFSMHLTFFYFHYAFGGKLRITLLLFKVIPFGFKKALFLNKNVEAKGGGPT